MLRTPAALELLVAALAGVDRLVLLGDTVELAEAPHDEAMAAAEPVLRALAGDREVVVVPGNHDIGLIRPWLRAHGVPDATQAPIPNDATPSLAALTSWLGDRVRVEYPGTWLSERVWATHGHYLDRHLLPDSAYGIARGLLGRLPRDGATPAEYEQRGLSITKVESLLLRRLPRPLAARAEGLAELLRASTMPMLGRRIMHPRFARLHALALGVQMRTASLPALARVVHRLGVDADWVVFGHVHRRGPLPADDPARWCGPTGRPRIANAGSWVYEPLLLHRSAPPHPYWPGGAILVEGDGDPRSVGLLDGLTAADLH